MLHHELYRSAIEPQVHSNFTMLITKCPKCRNYISSKSKICSQSIYSIRKRICTLLSIPKVQWKKIQISLSAILLIGGSVTGCSSPNNDIEITKELTISIQKYQDILNDFSNDLLLVNRNGKYGFIDKQGNEIIPCKYDNAYSFSKGLAVINKDGKYGVIDKQDNEIIPCKYKWSASAYSEGLLEVSKEGKYGYIDTKGKEVIPCQYDEAYFFSEGLAVVGYMVDYNIKYGVIDKQGNEIAPCEYEKTSYRFSEGLLAVKRKDKYGYIDKQGKEIIPCIYDYAYDFSEGMAVIVSEDGKRCVIDKKGNKVLPLSCNGATGFSEGMLLVTETTGKEKEIRNLGVVELQKYGFVDNQGKEIIPCKYDYAYDFSEGLAVVQLNGKYGFIDKQGNEVIPCVYDDANPSGFSAGLARVQCEGKWGFVDKKGNNTFLQYSTSDAVLKAITLAESELEIISVISSNALKEQTSNNYNPSNLLDNNISTAWATHFTGNGNESLTFTLKAKKLNKIAIMNGYRKNGDSYWNNSRAKLIEIQIDGNLAWDGELSDDNNNAQIIQLDESYSNVENITIIFYTVYEGKKWNDLCLSEIKFYGIKE